MNKIIIALVAMLVASSAFANDPFVRTGGGYRGGGAGYYGDQHHHDHHGPSLGQVVAGAVVLVGAAVVANQLLPQQPRVVYVVSCNRTPFGRGGLIYADPCDGSGSGPVVIGRY